MRPNSSVSCASPQQQPCLTFNEYAQQVDQYFVDDTIFLFLPGTHELDIPLYLKDSSNISLVPLNEESGAVQLYYISPSADVTWKNCEKIEISGFTILLSRQFSFLVSGKNRGAADLLSAEVVFHNTSAVLANLTLTGNGTRLFALIHESNDLMISNLMAEGIRAPILHASRSDTKFYGQNTFSN